MEPAIARLPASPTMRLQFRAAAIYSLLGTAKLNGVDSQLYMQHVCERIADHPVNRVSELLPWHIAPLLTGSESP